MTGLGSTAASPANQTGPRASRRRLAVVALAGVLPWVFVTFDGGFYTIFAAGFLHLEPLSFTSLLEYVGRVASVPPRLTAWPTAALLYILALLAAVLEYVVDLDSRIPAGLLFLAGVDVGLLGVSLSGQQGILAIPVGALWLWTAVWVGYADELLPGRS